MAELLNAGVVLAVTGAGLIVGALFAFSAFVMAALKRLDDAEGMRAMQQINQTVYTPWFMAPFFGTSLLSAAAVVVALANIDQGWSWPLLGAGLLYVIGVFGVTAFGNVPLNKQLGGTAPDGSAGAGIWRRYLVIWTRWNHVRVVLGTLSVLLYASALWIGGAV